MHRVTRVPHSKTQVASTQDVDVDVDVDGVDKRRPKPLCPHLVFNRLTHMRSILTHIQKHTSFTSWCKTYTTINMGFHINPPYHI